MLGLLTQRSGAALHCLAEGVPQWLTFVFWPHMFEREVIHLSLLRVAVGRARVRRPGERIQPTPGNIAIGLSTVTRFKGRGPCSQPSRDAV